MKPSLRILAGAAALLVLSITATGCSASPYAATVNSQVIKEPSLYSTLQAWAGNRTYVSDFDSAQASAAGQSGAQPLTVAGEGPGTYNTSWVAGILTQMIAAAVVHQNVVATGQIPSPAIVAAARSVSEIDHPGLWEQFPAAFRQTLANQLAEEAAITPPSVAPATLLGLYRQYAPYFFTQVCVIQAAAFTLQQAQGLVASGIPGGAQQCYDQAQFEQQSSGFQSAVMALAVGKVAPAIRTSYGYQVVTLVSRDVQAYTVAVQRALSVAVLNAQGTADSVVTRLLAKARVRINPAYGSWQQSQVVPPSQPQSSSPTT